jgi:hypothetical protein
VKSFGSVDETEFPWWFAHHASTVPGSSGAPVLSQDGLLVGVHLGVLGGHTSNRAAYFNKVEFKVEKRFAKFLLRKEEVLPAQDESIREDSDHILDQEDNRRMRQAREATAAKHQHYLEEARPGQITKEEAAEMQERRDFIDWAADRGYHYSDDVVEDFVDGAEFPPSTGFFENYRLWAHETKGEAYREGGPPVEVVETSEDVKSEEEAPSPSLDFRDGSSPEGNAPSGVGPTEASQSTSAGDVTSRAEMVSLLTDLRSLVKQGLSIRSAVAPLVQSTSSDSASSSGTSNPSNSKESSSTGTSRKGKRRKNSPTQNTSRDAEQSSLAKRN